MGILVQEDGVTYLINAQGVAEKILPMGEYLVKDTTDGKIYKVVIDEASKFVSETLVVAEVKTEVKPEVKTEEVVKTEVKTEEKVMEPSIMDNMMKTLETINNNLTMLTERIVKIEKIAGIPQAEAITQSASIVSKSTYTDAPSLSKPKVR
jgi:hypothetical protein